jgi:hypothetical protein
VGGDRRGAHREVAAAPPRDPRGAGRPLRTAPTSRPVDHHVTSESFRGGRRSWRTGSASSARS